MKRRRGRPSGVGNRKYRDSDHRDCVAIARLRIAEPQLTVWKAIFRIAGDGDGWKHQGARQRRLHRVYSSRESYYVALARAQARPARPATIAEMARRIEETWAPLLKAQRDYEELVSAATAGLAALPKNIW